MKPLLFTLIITFLAVGFTACGNKVPLSLPSESEISLDNYGRI